MAFAAIPTRIPPLVNRQAGIEVIEAVIAKMLRTESGEESPKTVGFREGSRIYYSDEMEYIARIRMKIIQDSNPLKDDPFQLPLEIRGTYLADKIAAVGLSPKVSTMLPLQEEMGRAAPPEPSPETEGLTPGC